MVFRLGSRKRKEKQAESEATKKDNKNKKNDDKLSARPPPVPGSVMKSTENRTSTAPSTTSSVPTNASNKIQNSQTAASSRNVLFRDNRFPDGTTMPRISTQQSPIQPPGADRESQVSPTSSIYSSASAQPLFPSLASYPPTYTSKFQAKHFDPTTKIRSRVYSDGEYNSFYGKALPKPDYPLSIDGTGNSNRDSGLDTESRSSSGGNNAANNVFIKRSRPGMNSFHSRNLSHDRLSSFPNFSEPPQILRPKGFQSDREIPGFFQSGYATPSRSRKPINNYDNNYRNSTTPHRWTCQKEDLEEETYRPRSASSQNHCSSCSCFDDVLRTPRCTGALRRIQLDEGVHSERWDNAPKSGKYERRFRREGEEEYSTKSLSRGLPRNQPVLGRYFEERDEVDRYGRLPPLKRPVGIRLNGRDLFEGTDYVNDDDGVPEEDDEKCYYSEEDVSDFQEGSYRQRGARNYGIRGRRQSDFYRRGKGPATANRDTSVIRL